MVARAEKHDQKDLINSLKIEQLLDIELGEPKPIDKDSLSFSWIRSE